MMGRDMKQHVVGVADSHVSNDPNGRIATYSLGSCIGLAIYDPVAKVGGLLHFMLPESSIDPDKARETPSMFADSGVPHLFKSAYKLGLEKKRTKVVVVGGAQILDESGVFNIGKRNYTALRKIFWKNNVLIDVEEVGGSVSRTLFLEIGTGKIWMKAPGGVVRDLMT